MSVHCTKGLSVAPLPLLEGDQHTLVSHAIQSNVDIQALFFAQGGKQWEHTLFLLNSYFSLCICV